jgi:energy-coupling factor transporter ATP-binding protein EcfA2
MPDGKVRTFRAFDIVVASRMQLPELKSCADLIADVELEQRMASRSVRQINWFHHWYIDDAKTRIAMSIAREEGGYRLRFPELADFLILNDGAKVICEPCRDTVPETIRHLFLDQVLPRILGQRGNLILHASSVEIQPGAGIAFAGSSGWGKSTLALSFHGKNTRFLGDDCMLLRAEGSRLWGVSAYRGSRLWQDSLNAIYPNGIESTRVSHYTGKHRIANGLPVTPRRTNLRAVFFLQDPRDCKDHAIHIERMHGSDMVMDVIKCSFLLDASEIRCVAKQFELINGLMEAQPIFYSIQYPRSYARLEAVRQKILDTVLGGRADSSQPFES